MNIKRKIFLGSRKSNLAKKQASLVKSCLLDKGINDVYEKTCCLWEIIRFKRV